LVLPLLGTSTFVQLSADEQLRRRRRTSIYS
jgi:hypothetical protein